MGVLNVTPDSFSDGGQLSGVDAAVEHALAMVAAGADLIDVGGESTRPGASPVPAEIQIDRVAPVIASLSRRCDTTISIDTTSAAVADAALQSGAAVVNDISAGRDDPGLFPLVAARGLPIVLMHMRGTPATMQQNPVYADVVSEVHSFLRHRMAAAIDAGIVEQRIMLDPGIGFGKTVEHNLELLAHLPSLAATGRPLVVGTSRKKFIAKVLNDPGESARLLGTAATVAWSVAHGAAIVRVHDVAAMTPIVQMIHAIRTRA